MTFASIDDALVDIREGKLIIVMDDPDRENEGDFYAAAERVSEKAINYMITHGRGLVCAPITAERVDELRLPMMTDSEERRCNFTVSVDHVTTGTGVSAVDRYVTIRELANPNARPEDFIPAGHVFPIRAHPDGLSMRRGHTEASIELARLAGCYPAGAICEVIKPDGNMARLPYIQDFARKAGLKVITIQDLAAYIGTPDLVARR